MASMGIPDRFAHLSPLKRALLAVEELQARLQAAERTSAEPIAVIGMGCRIPGHADTVEKFWQLLLNGECPVRDVPSARWDAEAYFDPDPEAPGKTYARRAAFLDDVDLFDAEAFGMAPREAVALDPQQRLLLEVAREALEDAGYAPDSLGGTSTGVFVGIASSDHATILQAQPPQRVDAYFASGMAHSMASGRLSYVFGLQGPSLSIDTACSSSLVAVHLAVQSLRARECRMALTAGVNLMLTPHASILFAKSRMLAPDGLCKTFDAAADGFGRGEGGAVLLLKRLSDAVADRDRILAVIRGSAVNQDGPSSGLTAPNGPAQQSVIRQALQNAGLQPNEVGYVEAHGTGTSLGDPIEVQALARAYAANRPADRPLLIGSLKTNVGHLEAAAGIAGLMKVVLAVQHAELPPHLHFTQPNPHVPWDRLSVSVSTERRAWPGDGWRRAAVSSFGFSGTNAHVIVEAPPSPQPDARIALPCEIVTVSARTDAALRQRLVDLDRHLEREPDAALCDVAFTANVGRAALSHRAALVAQSTGELRSQIGSFLNARTSSTVTTSVVRGADAPTLAFLFTGQGSQYPGMGRVLYERHPLVREILDDCARRIATDSAPSLVDVLFGASSAGSIHDTRWTQPALFALEYALARLWMAWGVQPSAVMGHSVGEFSAACVAGVISLDDALRLVAARGALMDALPRVGSMVAVRAAEPLVAELVQPWREMVSIAAVNGPAEVVISGLSPGIDEVVAEAGRHGIRTHALTVSHAFHSPSMDAVIPAFHAVAQTVSFREPQIPIVSNVTGRIARQGELSSPEYWCRHLRATVRFDSGLRSLADRKVSTFLEIGPAPTLTSLAAQILGDDDHRFVPSMRPRRDDWAQLLASLATLFTSGVPVDWAAFHAPHPGRRVRLPLTPFDRSRYRIGCPPSPTPSPLFGGLRGRRVDSPMFAGVAFDVEFSSATHAYLFDHRVDGLVVVPAAAVLELIRVNATQHLDADAVVGDLVLSEPLVLDATGVTHVQLVLAEPEGGMTAAVFSRSAGRDWIAHAQARVAPRVAGQDGMGPGSLDQIRARCADACSTTAHYSELADRGLELGPAFQVVAELWRGQGEALGRLHANTLEGAADGALVTLLDGGIQVAAAALQGLAEPVRTYLPFALGRSVITPATARTVWSHVVVRQTQGGTPIVDITLLDATGMRVGAIEGLSLRPADRRTQLETWFSEQVWQPQAVAVPVPVARVADLAGATFETMAEVDEIARYEAGLSQIERLAVSFIQGALLELGWTHAPGHQLRSDEVRIALRISERHSRLVPRLLEILACAGVLTRDGDAWLVTQTLSPADDKALTDQIRRQFPEVDAELTLLARCGRRLAAVLRDEIAPLELLFPGGDAGDAERLYRHSPAAALFNRTVQNVLTSAFGEGLRGCRILEVGGGTTATTHFIRDVAGEAAGYLFTDVSPTLVARASQRFRDWPLFTGRVFDLDREPEEQGFADADHYDVVVATNVMHATRDPSSALKRARRLLTPGGLLVLVEVVRPQHWIDVTFGLTSGWWASVDRVKRANSPLLTAEEWTQALRAEGFAQVACVPPGSGAGGVRALQAVILATTPLVDAAGDRRPCQRTVVHANDCDEGRRFIDEAALSGDPVEVMTSGDVLDGLQVCDRLIYLVSELGVADTDSATLMMHQQSVLGRLLACVQTLITSGRPRLSCWVITRGASAVTPGQRVDAAQATVSGLLATARREYPEVRWAHIDLDPDDGARGFHAAGAEFEAAVDEPIVACRDARRYVKRFAPAKRGALAGHGHLELRVEARGTLDTLRWDVAPPLDPGPGQVRIRVQASGVNFKDVLNVMGTLPGAGAPLGFECSGTVDAVGPGVADLAVGDNVMALASGALATGVLADARYVVQRPSTWTFEEAAAFPVAFVTAAFALQHTARVGSGDRVLIHSAAGGVGMAAMLMAAAAGAEVFATAGTAEKRRTLRDYGVQHVFDSRSTSFADGIADVTQGRGVTVVLNALGDDAIAASLRVLAHGGRFLEIGKKDAWSVARMASARPDVAYSLLDWSDTSSTDQRIVADLLREVTAAYAASPMPLPLTPYAASGASDALRRLASGRVVGKIVVRPPHSGADRAAVTRHATYLITGGCSGLGLATARWLVGRGAEHVLLLGRRAPDAAAAAEIERLHASGTDIGVLECDVADEVTLRHTLDHALSGRPPLKGVFHSAGVLDDATLLHQTWERFARVLRPKVAGAWALHRYTSASSLDFFILYSSIASVMGAPGQANHASANAYLDALAHERRRLGLPALSVNWGIWSGIGAGERSGAAKRAARDGLGVIAPAAGLEALALALAMPQAQLVIAPPNGRRDAGGLPTRMSAGSLAGSTAHDRPAAAPPAGEAPLRSLLARTPSDRRRRVASDHVSTAVARVLALDARRPDQLQPFHDMGLDSLMAVELRNVIARDVGEVLPATLLFDYPSVVAVTDFLLTLIFPGNGPEAGTTRGRVAEGEPSSGGDAIARIEELSDADVDRLLAERLGEARA